MKATEDAKQDLLLLDRYDDGEGDNKNELSLHIPQSLQQTSLASQFAAANPKNTKAGWSVRRSSMIPGTLNGSPVAILSDLLMAGSSRPAAPDVSPLELHLEENVTAPKQRIGGYYGCGICGTAFLALKRSVVPRGVFGKGKRARTAEGLAFFVYTAVVSVSLYWVAIYSYLYFYTGWLGNVSTTFSTYRSLEAPSVAICRDLTMPEELPWRISARVQLINSGKNYTAIVWLTPCPKVRLTCRCLNTWSIPFQDANRAFLGGLPVLHDETQSQHMEADSLHIIFDIFGRKKKGRSLFPASYMDTARLESVEVSENWKNQEKLDAVRNNSLNLKNQTYSSIMKSDSVTTTLEPNKNYFDGLSSFELGAANAHGNSSRLLSRTQRFSKYQKAYNTDRRIWLGVYDSKLIPELGDTPTWAVVRAYSEVTIGVSLVHSWVIDPQRMDLARLMKGEIAHGEHTYLLDIHSITKAARYLNKTKLMRLPSGLHEPILIEVLDDPLVRLNLSFSSFTVIEVWRVGVSMSVALVGLAAICLSAFNKMFIFNALFPYYDAQHPQKLHLTLLARILTCGYFGSNHDSTPKLRRSYSTAMSGLL